jgi:uncharacterized C2H2 Zn-finger protein
MRIEVVAVRMKAVVFYDRDGDRYYQCPRCGMIFKSSKEYSRHINRSHSHLFR